MLKDIIEFLLLSLVLSFVWNSVRRVLFRPTQRFSEPKASAKPSDFKNTNQNKNSHGLNWDAEDADFEEIKDDK